MHLGTIRDKLDTFWPQLPCFHSDFLVYFQCTCKNHYIYSKLLHPVTYLVLFVCQVAHKLTA